MEKYSASAPHFTVGIPKVSPLSDLENDTRAMMGNTVEADDACLDFDEDLSLFPLKKTKDEEEFI